MRIRDRLLIPALVSTVVACAGPTENHDVSSGTTDADVAVIDARAWIVHQITRIDGKDYTIGNWRWLPPGDIRLAPGVHEVVFRDPIRPPGGCTVAVTSRGQEGGTTLTMAGSGCGPRLASAGPCTFTFEAGQRFDHETLRELRIRECP